ncbi:MAG: sensor histidine kinase [Bacteroidales bacterium]|nr:sensor histidine kinase [Bacteroidales bacterium]
MEESGTLKWRFDVSTFRLIGRDLITDRVTALFELVKNCYDANATEVTITFENVGTINDKSSISIVDDGFGMSFSDIKDKWMVIGTSNKRSNPYTPAPFNRKCVGEKGIGRFAVDKLGDNVKIITKQNNYDQWLNVVIDWTSYYSQTKVDSSQLTLFTDVENHYDYTPAQTLSEHGTTLRITKIREIWLIDDINRFIAEASKLVSPFTNSSYPLTIKVIAPEYGINTIATKTIEDINISTINFSLDYHPLSNTQDTSFYNEETGTIDIRQIPIKSFGGISMRVYYFDDAARRRYRKEFPNNQIDGIKIYRDGIITTPFAENESDDDKKRDILGIDKRLWKNIFDRVSTREIIGFVEITKQENPNIIDATNRQDFVDNKEYQELKEFIITQLDSIENYKKHIRDEKRKKDNNTLESAGQDLQSFISSVETIAQQNPNLKDRLDPVVEQAKKTGKAVRKAIQNKKEAEKEFARKESIYMSIMSLQEYAIHITHAVRTTLNKIRDRVEYFNMFFPNPEEDALFARYAKEMLSEFKNANRVIDYMLSYSQSNIQPENIQLDDTIREIFNEYQPQFDNNNIKTDIIIPEKISLRNTHRQFFRDIFQNILDNSIKALKDVNQKMIRCSVISEDADLVIKISDNGNGIPIEKREWVFGLYNTTTQEQGGAGVGLYIVKTRVESLKGSVSIVDSEFGSMGTTIKIVLPFKK